MAYGQFTAYEPHPDIPGAYNFQTVDGRALTFGGPEADALRARLDAYNAATQVAGPGGGNPFDRSAADLKNAGNVIGTQNREAMGIAEPPAAPATAAPAGGGMKPLLVNGVATYLQGPDGRLYKRATGSPGISKEKLEKTASQGVATPTSSSETVQGAHPVNEDYMIDRKLANDRERDALEQQGSAEKNAFEAGQAAQRDQLAYTTGQAIEQKQQVDQIQAQVEKAQATRDQALKDYTSTRIDPERVFSGGEGFARRLGAAIAAAAGAWGATIGHTQNFAQQMIDSMIQRDINAQEADLRTKKDASDTALADLVRRGMSLDQAKGTLRQIQNTWAQQQAQLAAGASGSDQINAKWQQEIARLDKQNLDFEQAYRDEAAGKATRTVASQMLYPKAATGGGLVPLTPEEALRVAGTTAGTEQNVANTAKTISGIGAGGPKNQTGQRAEAALGNVDSTLKTLDRYEDSAVAPTTENQNVLTRAGRHAEDFIFGEGSSERGMSEHDRALIQDVSQAKSDILAMNNLLNQQRMNNPALRAAAEKGMAPGATVGDMRRAALKLKAKILEIQKTATSPGGGPSPDLPPEAEGANE